MHIYAPPANFDPTTATDGQLAVYGFPPRPTDLDQLAAWDTEFKTFSPVSPPPFIVELPNTTADTSSNWSGYDVNGGSGQFNSVTTGYYEPTFGTTRCSGDEG